MAWAEGDLDYEDDGGAIIIVLTIACGFSTFCFALELAIRYWDRSGKFMDHALPFLRHLHLAVEDVFQGTMYNWCPPRRPAQGWACRSLHCSAPLCVGCFWWCD